MIRDKVILFDKDKSKKDVFKIFKNICHFENENKENDMVKNAIKTADEVYDEVQLMALISEYSADCIMDKYIRIGENIFEFDLPEKIDIKRAKGIYSYIMTIGEMSEKTTIYDKFCQDALGTAYISYGRYELKKYLEKSSGEIISESIAPGTYSMKTEDVKLFFEISDGSKIGVRVNESSVMIPEKSCVGFFLKGINAGKKDCQNCILKNCEYCI